MYKKIKDTCKKTNKKNIAYLLILCVVVLSIIFSCIFIAQQKKQVISTIENTENTAENWNKIFAKNNEIDVYKVEFKNRFGITLVGDLYLPKNKGYLKNNLPAVAISGPFGAVKEQSSGLYAQTLAERGFVALAFDPSFTGESSGEPRDVASPDINTEDFSAAVDYLSNSDFVNPNKIAILGICGFGGFALNAAAVDTRIKAVITSTMYDMTRLTAHGYFDSMSENERYNLKKKLNRQRTKDFVLGTYAKADGLPKKLSGNEPQFVKDYYNFYKTDRGFHSRSINSNGAWNMTSSLSLMNDPILQYAKEIRVPVLLIHGEDAHSRYFSEDVFKILTADDAKYAGNKSLLIVPKANHTDLYDDMSKIPFDKIEKFLKDNL